MKHIIRRILKEEFDKTKMKKGQDLKGSQWLFDFIRDEEGDPKRKGEPVLKSYKIGSDVWTIGYGHTGSDVKPNMTIDKSEANRLMREDLTKAADCVRRLFKFWEGKKVNVPITQNMFDVLVSLVFNSGCNAMRGSDFIQLLKKGDYRRAANAIKTYRLKKGFSGLVDRRNSESSHFLS